MANRLFWTPAIALLIGAVAGCGGDTDRDSAETGRAGTSGTGDGIGGGAQIAESDGGTGGIAEETGGSTSSAGGSAGEAGSGGSGGACPEVDVDCPPGYDKVCPADGCEADCTCECSDVEVDCDWGYDKVCPAGGCEAHCDCVEQE